MARGTATVEYGVNIYGSAFSSDPSDQHGQSNGNLNAFQQLPNCSLSVPRHAASGFEQGKQPCSLQIFCWQPIDWVHPVFENIVSLSAEFQNFFNEWQGSRSLL
ncbi:hypothetical protein F3Y22_tig00112043pilonHSYRG00003 [Hibiscus syriacus]|uniref:Uncharacterized protein n=1 Tax=Hibiscus syriacus TaxID=106335 RepID=A0A6A2YE75_HIBSY|nr:hypothetical protein F3Y22_tig00112043pilonHSYRG00003 [Hibiscus syriacus]